MRRYAKTPWGWAVYYAEIQGFVYDPIDGGLDVRPRTGTTRTATSRSPRPGPARAPAGRRPADSGLVSDTDSPFHSFERRYARLHQSARELRVLGVLIQRTRVKPIPPLCRRVAGLCDLRDPCEVETRQVPKEPDGEEPLRAVRTPALQSTTRSDSSGASRPARRARSLGRRREERRHRQDMCATAGEASPGPFPGRPRGVPGGTLRPHPRREGAE